MNKITKIGKVTILYDNDNKIVKKDIDNIKLKELFNYLDSRGFFYHQKLIDDNTFEYIDDLDYPKEQKYNDMIVLLAKMHKSTSFYKEIDIIKINDLYNKLKNNLYYFKNKYNLLVSKFEEEEVTIPSHLLFLENYSKLISQINFCLDNLEKWYLKIKERKEYRICIIHNNMSLEHYLKNKKEYLISFDNYRKDSPIIDIYKLYIKDYDKVDFKYNLKLYFENIDLDDYEKELLFLLICMPRDISFLGNDINSFNNLEKYLDYVYRAEELVRPYYSVN